TTGPDGNLWAVEEQGVYQGNVPGTLDRITPNGATITRFPVPQQELQPGHLPAFDAPGPDGNVWFTEFAADLHLVGKITPTGTVTEYPLPGPLTSSAGITTGVDGRLWVTQSDASRVVVVNPDGTVAAAAATHHTPVGITIGPDGNMWFVASLDGEIGRIKTARPGYAYILDIAPGFVPAVRTVPIGTTVEWVLEAPGLHRVVDATGLGLYDSGPKPPVSFLTYRFGTAGTYPYADPRSGNRGAVAVPVTAPATGQVGAPFEVQWASPPLPGAGFVFDVQVRFPASTTWQNWKVGTTLTADSYVAAGAGAYAFRARTRNGTTASMWSPPATVTVTSP
ncbi:MAG TPA: hypothetical protein VKA30_06575, partial [Actinomycetota bacterium]|nr:hypothetical protein [Actinomycetota bacterium]